LAAGEPDEQVQGSRSPNMPIPNLRRVYRAPLFRAFYRVGEQRCLKVHRHPPTIAALLVGRSRYIKGRSSTRLDRRAGEKANRCSPHGWDAHGPAHGPLPSGRDPCVAGHQWKARSCSRVPRTIMPSGIWDKWGLRPPLRASICRDIVDLKAVAVHLGGKFGRAAERAQSGAAASGRRSAPAARGRRGTPLPTEPTGLQQGIQGGTGRSDTPSRGAPCCCQLCARRRARRRARAGAVAITDCPCHLPRRP
jgi:hypothetical protein